MPDLDPSQLPRQVAAKIEVDPKTDCWLWIGAHKAGGYGGVYWQGRAIMAHRVIYELLVGPIPYALVLDHLCRIKLCVNPAHLEPVTVMENSRRATGLPIGEAQRRRRERKRDPAYMERERKRRRKQLLDPAQREQNRERAREWRRRWPSGARSRRPGSGQQSLL